MSQDDPTWDPSNGGWLTDVMPAIMARQAAAEAHAASCADRPCETCDRHVCHCGAPVDGARECPTCSRESHIATQMRPTIASIPEDLRWAVGNTAAGLRVLSSRTGNPCVALPEATIARGLAAPPSQHLHFRGRVGAGKTTLAVAMLAAWVRLDPTRRRGSFLVDASALARARAGHPLGHAEAPLVARALRVPLLVLDDLGHETHDRDNCLSDVVYGRAAASRPTWVTTGLVANEDAAHFAAALAAKYDGGFARRIVELGKPIRLGAR